MLIVKTIAQLREVRAKALSPVVFIPTMGALHFGHEELIREGRCLAGEKGTVVVSIFVNPTQFGPHEDFTSYPRSLEKDGEICKRVGVDIVFAPEVGEMYAPQETVSVQEKKMSLFLCGKSRPGHFEGVSTVVTKLFHLVQPHKALFSKKDYQQLAIMKQLVRDLHFPIEIVAFKTVREKDGLAMSSRNQYLVPEERKEAAKIYASLKNAHACFERGERKAIAIEGVVRQDLSSMKGTKIDYVSVVDAETLEPLEKIEKKAVVAVAVFCGKTRLIDNRELDPARK